MKALSTPVPPVIVWINLVLIIRLTANALKKIVRQTHHQLVPVPLSAKPLAAAIVNNVVPIVVHPALSLIPAPMPQQQNAAINVITVIRLVLQVLLLLIPAPSALIMNADKLAKNVLPLVHRVA